MVSLLLKTVNYLPIIILMSFSSRLKYLAASVFFALIIVDSAKSIVTSLKNYKRLDESHAEISALQKQKTDLEDRVSYKNTGDYVEERARDDLNLIKPGEKVYIVTYKSGSQSGEKDTTVLGVSQQNLANKPGKSTGNWVKWYRLFF
jgi:cell division protein DivIC